jgi:hypothetical protein
MLDGIVVGRFVLDEAAEAAPVAEATASAEASARDRMYARLAAREAGAAAEAAALRTAIALQLAGTVHDDVREFLRAGSGARSPVREPDPDNVNALLDAPMIKKLEDAMKGAPYRGASPRLYHKRGEVRPAATDIDPYIVNGVPYVNAEEIPGNEPVLLTDTAGNAVLDSKGKPVYGPSRGIAQMEAIANQLDDATSIWERRALLARFAQAAVWDFQRMKDDDGSIIFTEKYTEFANIVIGYADGHHYFISTEWAANRYAKRRSKFDDKNEEMSQDYPALPQRIVNDFKIGRDLRAARPPRPETSQPDPRFIGVAP